MTVIGLAEIAIAPEVSGFASDLKTKIGDALKNPVVVAGAAIAAAGGAVTAFAKSSVDKFTQVGAEVKQLTKFTGESAETMSRLRFAAQETGVSTDALSTGIKKLSLNIESHNKNLIASGIAYQDATGKVLPMDQILGNVAAKFKDMPNGIEKNSLAVQLFGKSGTDLIPVLNKGKDGLAALGAEADKFGLTLTQKNLDAITRNTAAHREFQAALDGLKVQIGANLLPVLTDLFTAFSSRVIPIITDATSVVKEKFGPILSEVFGAVGDAVGKIGGVLVEFWQDFDNGINSANQGFAPIINVHSLFLDLGRAFDIVRSQLGDLVGYIRDHAIPWLVDEWKKAEPDVRSFWDKLQDAMLAVKGKVQDALIPKLRDLWDWLKNQVLPAAEHLAETLKNDLGPAMDKISLTSLLPLVIGLGALAEAFQRLEEFGPVASLVEGLGFSIAGIAIPGVVVAGVIVALGVAAVEAYQHFGPFRDVIDEVANYLQATVWPKIRDFGDWLLQKFEDVIAFVRDHWSEIQMVMEDVFNFVINDVVPVVEAFAALVIGLIDSIIVFIRDHWVEIKEIIEGVMIAVGVVLVVAFDTIRTLWTIFHNDIIVGLQGAWEIIKSTIQLALDVILAIFGIGLDLLTGHWGQAWDDIKRLVSDAWNAITGINQGAFDILKGIFGAALDVLKFIWSNAWGSIKDLAAAEWRAISGAISSEFNGVKNNIKNNIDTLVAEFSGLGGRIRGVTSGMWDGIKDAFRATINSVIGWWNGLQFSVPSVHVPGTNTDVGGFSFGTPDIPRLAHGAVVKARPGGTQIVAGEAGSDEAVIPLNQSFIAMLVQAMEQAGVGGRAGHVIESLTIQNNKTLQENLDEIDRLTPLVPA